MKIYWRLLSFAKPLGKYAIPYFFYTLLYALFNTFNFVMIMPILETLFDKDKIIEPVTQMPEFALDMVFFNNFINYTLYNIFGTDYSIMNVLALLGVFLVCISFMCSTFRYLGQFTIENLRIQTLYRLRNDVYNNVMELHTGYFNNARKGDIMSKITSDVGVVQFCITNTLQVAFREPFLIIGYMLVLINISWKLTIFSALVLPLIAFVIGSIVKRLRQSAREAQENFSNMTTVLDESLSGIKVIKAYNATDFIKQKFFTINKKFSDISRKMARRQQLASPASEFMGIVAASILLLYGGSLVLAGELNGSSFIAYLAIFTQITRPVRALTDAFANINQGVAAGERVLSLLDTVNEIPDKPNAIDIKEFSDSIEFKDVRFSYDTKEIIKGISFKVKHGETVALVGPSGGGKTTISDLIPRFFDVDSGEILIDGVNIKDYKVHSLRSHIGVVSQDTVLFNDTIENNLRLGDQDATLEEIEFAAKVSNAHEFIINSDNGYQNNVGDRGVKLSGGQRQRLSIARAVLKNPAILILDEATSALDAESERLVQEALNNLLKGRTSIVIAHRLSTIQNADRIIVIDQGKIIEEGSHSELLAIDGIYKRLISLQKLA